MKVLLSGATGLIGQAIGEELVRRGHSVTSLVRNLEKAKSTLSFKCELREWRSFEVEPKLLASDSFDSVIHLAGEPVAEKRWTTDQKKKIYDSRVIGSRVLAAAIQKQKIKLESWVQGSAIGIYGDAGSAWLDEDSVAASDFLAKVVQDWENEANQFAVAGGYRLVKIRTGIVLATESGALAKMLKVFKLGVGGKLGSGEQFMSWIHIDDIAGLFIFAAENSGVSGVINGVAPNPVTNKELTTKLAGVVGKREFLPVPKLALKIALGELATALLASARVRSRASKFGFKFKFETLAQALEDLT